MGGCRQGDRKATQMIPVSLQSSQHACLTIAEWFEGVPAEVSSKEGLEGGQGGYLTSALCFAVSLLLFTLAGCSVLPPPERFLSSLLGLRIQW